MNERFIFGVNKTIDWTRLILPEWVEKHKIRMRNREYVRIYLKGRNRIEQRYLVEVNGYLMPSSFTTAINFKLNYNQPTRRIL